MGDGVWEGLPLQEGDLIAAELILVALHAGSRVLEDSTLAIDLLLPARDRCGDPWRRAECCLSSGDEARRFRRSTQG